MIRCAATDMQRRYVSIVVLVLLGTLAAATLAGQPFSVTPQGARYQDLQPGGGEPAEPGDRATIHFIGWLDDNGERGRQLYNTHIEGRPVAFVIGTDRVMPAWNAGVLGMRPGGARMLLVPPGLAWGQRGVDDVVPPGASVMFRIELVSLEDPAGS